MELEYRQNPQLVLRGVVTSLFCLAIVGCTGVRAPIASVLSWNTPAPVSYGTALSSTQLNATADVPGTFDYSPDLGNIPSAGSHVLSVTFTPANTADYTIATASVVLIVNQSTPVLTWPPPSGIVYGTSLSTTQLNATASVPGTFSYSPLAGTFLHVGAHTLSVTFTPTDGGDYADTSGSVAISVGQATPRIEWVPNYPIAAGVPVGPAQLNAAALDPGSSTAVAGSFLYTPAPGAIFRSPGPEDLSVTFTPMDSVDYSRADARITMPVSSFGIAAWGDSLTQAAYPTDLAKLILLPVVNLGICGQTSTEIGVREGGIPSFISVTGEVIPANGSVNVTFQAGYAPLTEFGPSEPIPGSILGVHGVVSFASGIYTFTPTVGGNAVNAPGTLRFVVDTPFADYLPIFWEGRNNIFPVSKVLSDLAAQVATVPSDQTYLVMSVINSNNPSEQAGGSGYDQIVDLNAQLAYIYGPHYLDIRRVLVENYDPTQATDVSDFNRDEPPTSLRSVLENTTLGVAIGPADTLLTLTSTKGIVVGGILTIDTGESAENVLINGVQGDAVTVQRNFGGLNVSHPAGAPITETDYLHLNANGYQIVANAVATFLAPYKIPVK